MAVSQEPSQNVEQLFVLATRKQFRFPSVQGLLGVEDLWKLPLQSPKGTIADLDTIAVTLDKELGDNGGKKSFVSDTTASNKELEAKFKIVLHIIDVKRNEKKASEDAIEKAAKRKKLHEVLANRQNESLNKLTEEEILAKLEELG